MAAVSAPTTSAPTTSAATTSAATTSLAAAWLARSARSPRRTALIFDDERWSYAELHRAACHAARQLSRAGLAGGDRVILMMDNGPALVCAFFGCQLAGVVPIPVSPDSGVQRMRYLLDDSEAALVMIEPALPERIRSLHFAQAYGGRVVVLEPQRDDRACRPLPADPDGCAFIQYTSGSSADSKGVMVSHGAALASIAGFTAALELTRRDVFSSMLPMSHDMGLVCFGLAPLLSGYPLVLYRSGTSGLYPWLSGIARFRATITSAPDSLLQIANRVVEEPARYDLRSLRMLICGSEPVRRESIETFGNRFGVLQAIKPAYGMAEMTPCATVTPSREPARIDAQGHVGCGHPLHGVDVRIATDDGTLTRVPGVHGEIRVRTPAAMSGYWMRARESAAAFDDRGYLRTGDLGYLDEDGCLFVLGRMNDMLVAGGRTLSPHDLEAAATDMPAICRAAVVQSARDEARIIAILEVERMLLQDEGQLQTLSRTYRSAARARTGVAPSDCWFVARGRLPCTDNGKLRHACLRARIDLGGFVPAWADTSPWIAAVEQP